MLGSDIVDAATVEHRRGAIESGSDDRQHHQCQVMGDDQQGQDTATGDDLGDPHGWQDPQSLSTDAAEELADGSAAEQKSQGQSHGGFRGPLFDQQERQQRQQAVAGDRVKDGDGREHDDAGCGDDAEENAVDHGDAVVDEDHGAEAGSEGGDDEDGD